MSKRLYVVDYYGRSRRASWWERILYRIARIGGRA